MVSMVMVSPYARKTGARVLPSSRVQLRRLQRVFALLPVARAELVGLQRVEHAQHFLRVAADAQIVDRGKANHALGIDDEGGAQRHAGLLVEDAERRAQLALDVREPRECHLAQIGAALSPRSMNEVAVDRQAEQLRIAVAK